MRPERSPRRTQDAALQKQAAETRTYKDAGVQTDHPTPPRMVDREAQTTRPPKPLPKPPERQVRQQATQTIASTSVGPEIPPRGASLESGSMRNHAPDSPRPSSSAGSSLYVTENGPLPPGVRPARNLYVDPNPGKSPHPPHHQQLRHAHALMREEEKRMHGAVPGSEEQKLYRQNVQNLKAYEGYIEKQHGSSIGYLGSGLKREQRQIAHDAKLQKADLKNLRAALKPVEKDIASVGKQLAGLQKEKEGIEKQLAVQGAREKGDLGPVKISDEVTGNGKVKQVAAFDLGKAGRSIKGFFSRSPRLDKLSREDLQTRLADVDRDIKTANGWIKEYETEKTKIAAAPRYMPTQYDAVPLPSREQILKMMHESQPLRKTPWKDPLAKPDPAASKPMPELKSAMKKPGGPTADPAGKRFRFNEHSMGNPDISMPIEGRRIPAGVIGVPPNRIPPPSAFLPPPQSPFDPRPAPSRNDARPSQAQGPGAVQPRPGSVAYGKRVEGSVDEPTSPIRMAPRPNGARPIQISAEKAEEVLRLQRAGKEISIPPEGLVYQGKNGPELIL